jgi:hypothetical protein
MAPLPRPLVRPWRLVRRWLPPLNFITIHYAYFVVTCLISAVIFWGASTPAHSVRFIDALFLVVSAMTLSGLGTINLSTVNTFQQVLLFLLIMMGSAIFVSGFVVHVRKRAFEKKFRIVIERERRKDGTRRRTTSLQRGAEAELGVLRGGEAEAGLRDVKQTAEGSGRGLRSAADGVFSKMTSKDKLSVESAVVDDDGDGTATPAHLTFSQDTRFRSGSASEGSRRRRSRPSHSLNAEAAESTATDTLRPTISIAHSAHSTEGDKHDPNKFLDTSAGWISRNSQFHGLTERERERLGGYEYRAVALLAWLVPAYSIMFQLLGCLGCGAWVAYNRPDTATANGINPWWVGAFNAVSAFSKSIDHVQFLPFHSINQSSNSKQTTPACPSSTQT